MLVFLQGTSPAEAIGEDPRAIWGLFSCPHEGKGVKAMKLFRKYGIWFVQDRMKGVRLFWDSDEAIRFLIKEVRG